MYIENAKVTSCDVVVERGFVISASICFESSSGSQCYGGVVLGGMTNTSSVCNNHAEQPNYLAEWCAGILGACEAESLQQCVGKIVRLERADKYGKIEAVGHAYKDFWFRGVSHLGGSK